MATFLVAFLLAYSILVGAVEIDQFHDGSVVPNEVTVIFKTYPTKERMAALMSKYDIAAQERIAGGVFVTFRSRSLSVRELMDGFRSEPEVDRVEPNGLNSVGPLKIERH